MLDGYTRDREVYKKKYRLHDAAASKEGRGHKPAEKGTTKKRGKENNTHVTQKKTEVEREKDRCVRRTSMIQAHGVNKCRGQTKKGRGASKRGELAHRRKEKKRHE
jgi:hypothetical protein